MIPIQVSHINFYIIGAFWSYITRKVESDGLEDLITELGVQHSFLTELPCYE